MTDIVSRKVRSRMMSGIRGKDTRPEMIVRRSLHSAGFRYRLHVRTLPGSPDIVLPRYKTVVFVHGCFWHRHSGCRYATTPATRKEFWKQKFESNIRRDGDACNQLVKTGWCVLVVWECGLRGDRTLLLSKLFDAIRKNGNSLLEFPDEPEPDVLGR